MRDPTKIKDLARNTIVVPADKVDSVANELAARGATVKRIDAASNEMGYIGQRNEANGIWLGSEPTRRAQPRIL